MRKYLEGESCQPARLVVSYLFVFIHIFSYVFLSLLISFDVNAAPYVLGNQSLENSSNNLSSYNSTNNSLSYTVPSYDFYENISNNRNISNNSLPGMPGVSGSVIDYTINNSNNAVNGTDFVIVLDKAFYFVSDFVNIRIDSYKDGMSFYNFDRSKLSMEISIVGDVFSYKYVGLIEDEILFYPEKSATYNIRVYYDELLVDEKNFFVYEPSNLGCVKKSLTETSNVLIDLSSYDALKSSNNLVIPSILELLYDDSVSIKKYSYKTNGETLISWNPPAAGVYSLYADGLYIDCFEISLDNAVNNGADNNYGGLLNDSGNSEQSVLSNENYYSNIIRVLDSKDQNVKINMQILYPRSAPPLDSNYVIGDVAVSENGNLSVIKNGSVINSENLSMNLSMNGSVNVSINVSNSISQDVSLNVSINLSNNVSSNISLSRESLLIDNSGLNNLRLNDSGVNNATKFVADEFSPGQVLSPSDIRENATYDIEMELIGHPVKSMKFSGYKNIRKDGAIPEIGIDKLNNSKNYIVGRNQVNAYAINLYDMQFDNASFNAVAQGKELWKCKDWNFTTQECFGTWELYMNLTPGLEYAVSLFPGDPGFVEAFDTNQSVDVDLLALDNNTIVMAWVSAATGFPLKIKVMNTNGSIILSDTTIDATGDSTSRVALAPYDSNTFVIGAFDGPSQAQYFYIYDRSGTALQGQTSADPLVGTQSDVDVCQLGDRFPFVYANDDAADQDADFRIFYNNGSQAVGETTADTSMTPEASNQNIVSCAVVNSTRWTYTWYDAGVSDDVSIAAYSNTGTSIVGAADIDAAVGNAAQLASTGLRNRRVAIVFYDAADTDITITVRQLNGATLSTALAVTDIDTAAGAQSRVAIQEIDMVTQSYFVVAWQDTSDTTIKAGIYNETGAQITAPFTITSTPSTTNRILDLAGYSSNSGIGLCNGTWAIAYSNSSGNAVWETYYFNGARWNGVCPDVAPPVINLTYPENNSVVELLTYKINYTVTDDRDVILRNCSLYSNFSGSFIRNQTIFNVSVGNNSFNITGLSDRQYLWNIICFDNSTNNAFAQSNYTYKQNYYPPTISSSTINNTLTNQSGKIKFNTTINDSWNISYSYITIKYPDTSETNISLNRSGVEHYIIFNDTVQTGIYNITFIWANDTLSQANSQSLNLNFEVTSSNPSEFTLLYPSNGNISKILAPNLTWQQTVDETFSNYTIILDKDPDFGSADFIYYTYSIAQSHYVVDFALDANEIYYWKVIAYDIFGNSRNSTDIFSYITDTLPPSIQFNSPENNTYTKSSVLFNYTPSDLHDITKCELYGNWSGLFIINYTDSIVENSEPNYFNASLSDGLYLWNVRCQDIANNSGFAASNQTFIVDNTGPYVSLISPLNNTLENMTNNVLFYANSTDALSNIENCSLIIDNSFVRLKSPIIEGAVFNITYFLDNGKYNWSISCNDSNGNIGNSVTYNLTVNVVDSDPPFIIRNYPSDNLHISNNYVLFNLSIDDSTGIENCSIYINGVINYTQTNIINHDSNYFNITNFQEGTYTWFAGCYDNTTQKNYVQTTTRTFFIDLTAPIVYLISPNDTYLNYGGVVFLYQPIENHLVSCSLYGNFSGVFAEQQLNITPENGSTNYFTQNIADGSYIWNVLCQDESSRSAYAPQNYTFIVDTTAPYYYNAAESPSSPVDFGYRTYTFNMTWGDGIGLGEIIFENNFSGAIVNQIVNTYVISGPDRVYYYNLTNIVPGSYYYRWYANDSAGNFNVSEIFYYYINIANSSIYALIDGVNYNKSINEDSYANISLNLSVPQSGYVELLINGTIINNGTYGANAIHNYTYFTDPGVYNVTAIYYQTPNYSYSSDSVFLTVNDTTAPVINLISPSNNSPVSAGDINLQYIVNDKSAVKNCSVYVNGSFKYNSSNVEINSTQGFTASLGTGNYSWYVGCYDLSNNYNASTTRYFRAYNVSIVLVNLTLSNVSYQSGELAEIHINTSGFFGESMNSNFTAYIINGNTTTPWGNTSYINRKNLLLNNTYDLPMTRSIEINFTGLNGTINNCTKMRVAYFDGITNVDVPHELISGDNNNSCNIWFTATIAASSVSSNYYIYYDNSSAPYSGSVELAGIKIQRGTVAGTTASLTADIESANRSKSFILFTVNSASSAPTIIQFTPTMSIDTQIGFDRYGSGTSANISWQLVEGSDLDVQRGSGVLAAAAANVNFTINEVNLSSSFILVDGRVNTATTGNNIRGFFSGRFINSTAISLERATTGTVATASYQVVNWNNTNVQYGNVSFATASTVQSITAVNISRSFIVISRREVGNTGPDASLLTASFINSTAINLSRFTAVGTASVHWFVVELPESYGVQGDLTSVGAADINQPVNPVVMRKSFHVEKWSNTNGGTTFSNALMTSMLTNSSNIFFNKQTTTNINAINWFLIEEKQPAYSIGTREILVDSISNDTAPLGEYLWMWPTYNRTLSLYSVVAYAQKYGYESSINYANFEIDPDITMPNITLMAPVDMMITGQGYFNFSYIPYDWNLKNCTLYYGTFALAPNQTDNNPINNVTNNFTNIYLSVGLYYWNVLCYDTFGNSAFAQRDSLQYDYLLNITGPDLFVNNSMIWFSEGQRIEGINTTIYANISNNGLSPNNQSFIVRFFRNDPLLGGTQIDTNKTVSLLNPGEYVVLNVTYVLDMGVNNIFVIVDQNNLINETSEINNKANNSIVVSLYQYYYGNVTADILLGSGDNATIVAFGNITTYTGHLFIADQDSTFSFSNLKALGRNKNNLPTANDFSDIDSAMNLSGSPDSVNMVWANNTNVPSQTIQLNMSSSVIYNVPVVNTTNSTYFITGILWDTNDDLSFNDQYDSSDKEDVVFVTEVKNPTEGEFGMYSYEIRVPAKLKKYKGASDLVDFYYELK